MNRHPFFNDPPGGLMVWIFLMVELLTFGLFVLIFVFLEQKDPEVFARSRALLDAKVATLNTMLLITSGLAMALAVHESQWGRSRRVAFWTLLAGVLGFLFLLIKSWEYLLKWQEDVTLSTSTFFAFYYFTTFAHYLHVLLGLGLMAHVSFNAWFSRKSSEDRHRLTMTATYWHLCDLIWLMLFPMLYLGAFS
jgi:nitric oxide reductase NorE protein